VVTTAAKIGHHLAGRIRAGERGFAGRVARRVEERASQQSTGDDWIAGEVDEEGGGDLPVAAAHRPLAGETRRGGAAPRSGGLN